METQLKEMKVNELNPIYLQAFLKKIRGACDSIEIYEAMVMWLFTRLTKKSALLS